ncbi:MAG: LVIVD repeat-containing protein, partial [Candidatus Thorarchaeota archaeon]
VRNLSMPIKIGNFIGANYINGLVIRNSTILATSFSDGLIVVDISNLSHPIEQSRFSLNHIQPITLYNDFALISGLDYFYVLDISNLSNISELTKYDYEISNFKIISSIAYVACSGSILEEAQGFKILDITDLKDIRELGSFDDGGHPIDLIIKDNYAFIANFDHGVDVLDITSRSNIFKITNYFDGGNAHGLEIVNDLLYVADGVDGLEILKIDSTNNNANTAKTVSEAQTAPSFSIILLLGTLVLLTRNKKITQ